MTELRTAISGLTGRFVRKGDNFNLLAGLLCCFLLGFLDFLTPDEYVLSFLYILPISFMTLLVGKRAGLSASVLCTIFLSHDYFRLKPLAAAWNIFSAFGIFCAVTIMLSRIRQLLEIERHRSMTDPLTGAMNPRGLSDLAQYEMLLSQRLGTPYTLAFLDIDDFKSVNDTYGHKKGDELLKSIITCISLHLRKTDIVTRMGGDEFSIFFPGTDHPAAKVISQKIRAELAAYSRSNDWSITVSMGVVTCSDGSCGLDEIMTVADNLMYQVKSTGKNNVAYAVYHRDSAGACRIG